MRDRLIQVALPFKFNRLFDYRLPESLSEVAIGARVRVPFGAQERIGIVVQTRVDATVDPEKLKTIEAVLDTHSLFPSDLWSLLLWAAHYYHRSLGDVLFHALPVRLRQGQPWMIETMTQWQVTELGHQVDIDRDLRSKKQQQLLLELRSQSPITPCSTAIFKGLQQKGYIVSQTVAIPTDHDWASSYTQKASAIQCNPEQKSAIEAILAHSNFQPFLLDGVTGSGKTEVYLQVIDAYLQKGQQILVLVPEIGLTPQTVQRFRDRFHAPIEMLHSNLSDKERQLIWQKAAENQIAIVIGTRSGIFTPFQQLGLIIVDEEHDSSYKQHEGWRYHARHLAIMRAKLNDIPIVLGSATPALETIEQAKQQRYQRLALTQRAGDGSMVKSQILDIRGLPLIAGIAMPLMHAIEQELKQENQVLLFLNRRGFSPVILCHDCGWIAECPHCDKAFTYHQKQHQLRCHHCELQRAIPTQCPSCGSTHLLPVGYGTEQIEVTLKERFPEVPIVRIDRETTRKKGALAAQLASIEQGGKQILIGTQMLAKGHHFPDVTLVGVLDVDGALFSTHFRATELFAQIFTQVAGRAGRAQKPGRVVLQTHHPEHPLLLTLLHQGYDYFAQEALQERAMLQLPPFSYQVQIGAADQQNRWALPFLQKIKATIQQSELYEEALWILGPEPSHPPKKAGYFYYEMMLQHSHRSLLQRLLASLLPHVETWPEAKKVRWWIDVDPL